MMRSATETITVWNRYRMGEKDAWQRSVVEGCAWEMEIVRAMENGAARLASAYTVLVEENPAYRPFEEWQALPQKERQACFTFSAGDLVALGVCAQEITGAAPHSLAEVKTRLLPNAFVISAFADLTQGYKQGGHYELQGV